MKTIHSLTVAILPEGAPAYGTTKRTYYFATVGERMDFEKTLDGVTVKRVGVNIEHVMTANEVQRDIEREKKLILRAMGVA